MLMISPMVVDNACPYRDAVLKQKDIVLGRKALGAPSEHSEPYPSIPASNADGELAEIRDILLRIKEEFGPGTE